MPRGSTSRGSCAAPTSVCVSSRPRRSRSGGRPCGSGSGCPSRSSRSHEGALLHRANCGLYKSPYGFISAEDAAIAIDEPDIEACQICLPDNALPPI
ncbi:DUF6233 domain-containing protein [Streptomyces sp. NPDC052299]|uniref:DUF6233 domain-containing protein n=1 Tax=Streptomyces sp. NPDC052299 TaxID=3155054 RepID=UPI0034361E68